MIQYNLFDAVRDGLGRPGPAERETGQAARFAPRCPLALVAPFRGAKSSHNFRAPAWGRPAFPWPGLLPAAREPLFFRSGEQNLHTISAPTPGAGRLFQGAVCSPLPASPCSSVPGSKIFTQIPRPRPVPADFSKARFAPRCPRALVLPFRGAKSSHNFRAPTWGRPAFQRCGLLPASPCSSVSGSKIFTQFPRPRPGPAGFSAVRFAPLSPLALVAPFRGANFFTSGLPTPLVTSRPPMYNCYV